MTVLEVIQRSTEFLARKGVESPRLQVELLLAHVLGMPRLQLYLDYARGLSEPELASLRELMRRRGNREPLQHLLGTASFCGLEFAVDSRVLIPRPETELLAERAGAFLRVIDHRPATALDFGTGSGCLAIALATQHPGATICAVDISAEALAVARANATRHALADRLQFLCGDGFAALPGDLGFDLIVANPPYVPTSDIASLQPEVRDHEPRIALDGGPDGLAFMRRLATEAPARLQPAGRMMVECGDGQAARVQGLLGTNGWEVEAVVEDYQRHPRILIARLA